MIDLLYFIPNHDYYTSEQVKVLSEQMWSVFYDHIYSDLFLPFVCYLVSNIFVAWYLLMSPNYEWETDLVQDGFVYVISNVGLFVFTISYIYALYMEYCQAKTQEDYTLFEDMWNTVDCLAIVTNLVIIYAAFDN